MDINYGLYLSLIYYAIYLMFGSTKLQLEHKKSILMRDSINGISEKYTQRSFMYV